MTATFAEASTVSVERVGTNLSAGRVVSNPAGIDCSGTCSSDFAVGSEVSLTANETAGATFIGWSGDAMCLGFDGCTFAVASAPMSVRATFNVAGEYIYDVVSNVVTGNIGANMGDRVSVAADVRGKCSLVGEIRSTFVDFGWTDCSNWRPWRFGVRQI